MPIDVTTLDSPGWWTKRLADKLTLRQKRLTDLMDRFEGSPPLPPGAESAREAYRAFHRMSRTNYAELIVEAARERMAVTGFRTAAADDDNGDEVARRIWEDNGLDVEAADVHQLMLAAGDGYVIVGGDDERNPIITGEDPRQVVTIHDPVRQRIVRAGLKMFHDPEQDTDFAYLYLPGRRHVAYREVKRTTRNRSVVFSQHTWDWFEDMGGADGEAMPHDRVPVVRFRNKRGVGEFENHRDLLDRINFMILQRLVIAIFQAFRQRAAKNLPDENPETGEAYTAEDWRDVFTADPGALWQIPEGVELWESEITDLTPMLASVKDDVRDLAAVTRTPLSYLHPDAVNQSAEGAALMREGHVFKVSDRIVRATEGWKDVMSLAFLVAGDEQRADRSSLRVMWADPERRSLAERADAASKAQDIPWRSRMEHVWGFAPKKVDDMEDERAADVMLGLAQDSPDAA